MKEGDVGHLIPGKLEGTQAPFFGLCLTGKGTKDVTEHEKLDMLSCGSFILERSFESIEPIKSAQEAFRRVAR